MPGVDEGAEAPERNIPGCGCYLTALCPRCGICTTCFGCTCSPPDHEGATAHA